MRTQCDRIGNGYPNGSANDRRTITESVHACSTRGARVTEDSLSMATKRPSLPTLKPRIAMLPDRLKGSRSVEAKVLNYGQGRGGRPWRRLRARILLRDQYTCQLCFRVCMDHDLDVDHITPLAQGGTDDPANLRTLCRPCHVKRGRHG